MEDLIGWWLDEYDGPRFRQYVDYHGGTPYLGDPLATAEGECWTWVGWRDENGYGRFRMGDRQPPAHQVAYLDGGPKTRILPGQEIDHLCRNPSCVNPLHLEAVTHEENIARGRRGRAAVKACPHGHAYDAANTIYEERNGRQIRICRECKKRWNRDTYDKKLAAEGRSRTRRPYRTKA